MVFVYFLTDIVSLPQDIYYIWATISSDLDLSSSLTQVIGFGLAGTNLIVVIAIITGLFLFNSNLYTSPNQDTLNDAIYSLIMITF